MRHALHRPFGSYVSTSLRLCDFFLCSGFLGHGVQVLVEKALRVIQGFCSRMVAGFCFKWIYVSAVSLNQEQTAKEREAKYSWTQYCVSYVDFPPTGGGYRDYKGGRL